MYSTVHVLYVHSFLYYLVVIAKCPTLHKGRDEMWGVEGVGDIYIYIYIYIICSEENILIYILFIINHEEIPSEPDC